MSPIQALFQSFSQSLPPGSTIYLLAAELPDGSTRMHAGAAGPGTLPAVMSTVPAAPAAPSTPLTRVAALRAAHKPETALKLRDLAKEVGVSQKELRRAIKAGALAFDEKEDGRDNGAHTVTIGEMESYLKTISDVEAGKQEPPDWWEHVRGSRAA